MRKIKKGLLLAGSAGAVYLFFRFLLFLILPILLAWVIGRLLHPVVRFFCRGFHLPKCCSVILVLLLFVIFDFNDNKSKSESSVFEKS